MHRRGATRQENNDDELTTSSINTQTTIVPRDTQILNPYVRTTTRQQDCFGAVTNFANQAIQSAATTFAGFKGAMNDILPKLNEAEQRECFDTFSQYHELLMTTQRFVTRTLTRVHRARRTDELLKSIDLPSIMALCVQIRGLLNQFRYIEGIIDDKVKDQQTLQSWRNVLLGLFALATAVCLIATGVGAGVGFSAGVHGTIVISGTVAGVAGAGALAAHVAQKLTKFELVLKNLSDIEALLSEMSQNYSKIEAMGDLLQEDDESKQQFIKLLNELQQEVDKGFVLLTKM